MFLLLSIISFEATAGAQMCKILLNKAPALKELSAEIPVEQNLIFRIRKVRSRIVKNIGKAANTAELLLKEYPEYLEVQLLYIEVQAGFFRYEKAAALLKPLILSYSHNFELLRISAEVLIALGDADGALQFIERALLLEPEHLELNKMRFEVLIYKGLFLEAEAFSNKFKEHIIRSYYRASLFINLDKESVYRGIRILESFSDQSASILWKKAEAYYRLRKYQKSAQIAFEIFNASGTHDKTHAVALLLKIYEQTNEIEILTLAGRLSSGLDTERINELSTLEDRMFFWYRPLKSEIARFRTKMMYFY